MDKMNENEKIIFNYLKKYKATCLGYLIGEIGTFYEDFEGGYLPKDIDKICKNLTKDEETQIVKKYIKWREEEENE